jgi:hypothetical protein
MALMCVRCEPERNSPSHHGNERIQRQTNHQEHFRDRDPEFYFSKPPDRVELDQAKSDDTGRDEDSGVERVCPVLDNDVDGCQFEAD